MQWALENAIAALNRNAASKGCGKCARYVRMAIEAGGISTAGRPVSACQYVNFLPKIGFNLITTLYGREVLRNWSNTQAQKGDIAVMNHDVHGHICMWNGSRWISDFYQNNMWVYKGDGTCYLYRFNGEINNVVSPMYQVPQYQPPMDFSGNQGASVFSPPSGNTLSMDLTASQSMIKDDKTRTRIYMATKPTIVLDEFSMNAIQGEIVNKGTSPNV